ncbi:unnamed protein product, partial [Rotaria sp. Silwood2]
PESWTFRSRDKYYTFSFSTSLRTLIEFLYVLPGFLVEDPDSSLSADQVFIYYTNLTRYPKYLTHLKHEGGMKDKDPPKSRVRVQWRLYLYLQRYGNPAGGNIRRGGIGGNNQKYYCNDKRITCNLIFGKFTSFWALGFTSLGVNNQAFSISFWIKPQTLSGTVVHLSSSPSGNGSTCFSLLGFASNGTLNAQLLTNNGTIVTTVGPILPVSLLWILVVQIWSTTNGLKLYVNNTLFSSIAASTFKGSEITPNYLTLTNCLTGCGVCSNGLIASPGLFAGAIDDWRIYYR